MAGGHLIQPAIESLYSGVVYICSIHLILPITELNDLTIYQADIGNAYLEAYTKEKTCFIARREFATFGIEGHILINLKHYMGYNQAENDFMKFLQTCFILKDLHHARPILVYG